MDWSVYMILASDQSLYTGITTNMERRWQQHSSGKGGARFFRGRSPLALAYFETGHDRSSASRREIEIKKLTRPQKECLLSNESNQVSDFSGLLPTVQPSDISL